MLMPIVPAGQSIPPGLSQAMLIKGGNLLVLSGHLSVNSEGAVVGSDVESQLIQTFNNIRGVFRIGSAIDQFSTQRAERGAVQGLLARLAPCRRNKPVPAAQPARQNHLTRA